MTTQALVQAGVLKRLTALVYDFLILTAISFCYGWLVLMIKYQLLDIPLPDSGRADLGGLEGLGLLLVLIGFYCFFWLRGGQTLGMKAWRIRLLSDTNEPANLQQCLKRSAVAPLCILACGLGYIWCLFDKDRRALQDRLSATQVVQLKK